MSAHAPHSAGRTHCQNCAAPLQGPFCHQCGQHDIDLHRSFGHVFMEALESFLHFDGKFFTDTRDLLFRPGVVTRDFNEGRRARHVPPLRLYIFVSLVFFLFLSLRSSTEVGVALQAGQTTKDQFNATEGAAPPASAAVEEDFAAGLQEKAEAVSRDPESYRKHFLQLVPKMLLLCLPLYALASRVLFLRSGQNYLQHLVASLHLHTFVFLLWLAVALGGWALDWLSPVAGGVLRNIALLYVAFYLFKTLRTLYGESRLRTALKAVVLGGGYGLTLAAGFVTVAYLSLD